jgi:outer membrane receptor for monomeric catechols
MEPLVNSQDKVRAFIVIGEPVFSSLVESIDRSPLLSKSHDGRTIAPQRVLATGCYAESVMKRLELIFVGAILAATSPNSASADSNFRNAKSRNHYYQPYATGVDGHEHPIMQIPGSATVLSREILDDQNARSLRDALRGAAGVTVTGR